MGVSQQVDQDLIRALKEHDSTTLSTLRLVKAAAKNAEIAKLAPLTENEYRDVISRQAKLRREAAAEYDRASRPERAAQERAELAVLQLYLPEQLSEEDVRNRVKEVVAEMGATGPGDLGAVMSRVMPSLRGRADGSLVNQVVRALLSRNET